MSWTQISGIWRGIHVYLYFQPYLTFVILQSPIDSLRRRARPSHDPIPHHILSARLQLQKLTVPGVTHLAFGEAHRG